MNLTPELISQIPGAWPQRHGFTVPDWEGLLEWSQKNFLKSRLHEVYTTLADYWLAQLRDELGGTYRVYKGDNLRLLSSAVPASADRALDFFRRAESGILELLPGISSRDGYGPAVLIMFDEAEDFYAFTKPYYPDGNNLWNSSDGVFVNQGYGFIAVVPDRIDECKQEVFYLICQQMLSHLELPYWLEYGLALKMGKQFFERKTPEPKLGLPEEHITPELAYDLCSHWSAHSIQQFWYGESFFSEGSDLGYYLAEALVDEILTSPKARDFILAATWQDAGEAAARKHLQYGLSELASLFLGEGDWGPKPGEWTGQVTPTD